MPESATQIGIVTIAHGNAIAEGAGGVRPLVADSPVYADEIIKTVGDGSAVEIKFQDGAMLSQGPDSTVVLDDYVYDVDESTGEMAVKLLQGTLRSVTGEIVDNNPEGFKIQTPLATIGIRGTTTGHVVGPNGEQHVVVDFVDRAVVIGHDGQPPRVITQDGMGVMATAAGLGPVRPAPPNILANLEQLSSGSLEQGAPTFQSDGPGEEDVPDAQDGQDDAPADGGEGQQAQAGNPGEANGQPADQAGDQPQPEPQAEPQAQTLGLATHGQTVLSPSVSLSQFASIAAATQQFFATAPASAAQAVVLNAVDLIRTVTPTVSVSPTTLDLSSETSEVNVDLSSSPSTVIVGDESYTIASSYVNVTGSSTASNTLIGNDSDNILIGGSDTDTLQGGDGDDTLYGNGGNDSIDGGNGDNDMVSYAGFTEGVNVYLADGDPQVSYLSGDDTLTGIEHVTGTSLADTLWGDSGDNILIGGDGADLLWGGGAGSDSLYGQGGDDIFKIHNDLTGGLLDGGDGDDVLKPWADGTYDITGLESATDIEGVVFATTGSNLILQATDFGFDDGSAFDVDSTSVSGTQYLEIQSSATATGDTETIDLSGWTFGTNWTGGSGYIKVTGDVGDETITGSSADDSISGGDGDDVIYGSDGTDSLYGDAGNDSFDMGTHMSSSITLDGGAGEDTLYFTDSGGTSDLNGMVNIEKVVLGDANTSVRTLCASVQSNLTVDATAITSSHTFEWNGSAETDYAFDITGGEGQNTIIGSLNADTIVGGSNDDVLQGYGGVDELTGGGGNDTFVFEDASYAGDLISDFGDGDDQFEISNIFTGANGSYDSSHFARVTSAYVGNEGVLGNEGFVYEVVDDTHGYLWYDSDGSTDGNETLIAEVTMATSGDEVDHTDIDVV